MRKLIIALGISLLACTAIGQTGNNVFWTMRVKPKMDKLAEIEKKLPLFLKTHYPTLSFRVYETITGPNSGSYVIVTGPYAFKDFDAPMVSPKGEALQTSDGMALNALYESSETMFYRTFNEPATPKTNREIKFIQVTEREYESGSWSEYSDFLKKLRVMRDKSSKIDISYMEPVAGGNMNTFATVRFFSKWEELDSSENLAELYDNMYGRAAWSNQMRVINPINKSVKQEVRVLRKDLSATATAGK